MRVRGFMCVCMPSTRVSVYVHISLHRMSVPSEGVCDHECVSASACV